ncbi:MAG: rRNA maturation RNase YbeY [Magnetococcales bacterium]|nr:rRNA maturation RNase YbeY [Magnetococcales bacterium]
MSATVLVNLSSPLWPAEDEERVARAVHATLEAEGRVGEEIEVGVLLTDDAESRRINQEFRGLDRPANVLSFAMEEGEAFPDPETGAVLLGDVVIPFETTQREAGEAGLKPGDRLVHLVIHGVLHLLGYDHERSEAEAERQEAREVAILAGLGIANPYEI